MGCASHRFVLLNDCVYGLCGTVAVCVAQFHLLCPTPNQINDPARYAFYVPFCVLSVELHVFVLKWHNYTGLEHVPYSGAIY